VRERSKLKISIITVVFNTEKTIADTIFSLYNQHYDHIEHIIIDGQSSDNTVAIIRQYESKISYWVSEPDTGIYDAMNKGIARATGDIIGFLNGDDVYAHADVLCDVAKAFQDQSIDACYADLVFVRNQKVVRHYNSGRFTPSRLAWGWMPAHPTLYVRASVFQQFGGFKLNYIIAADYEFIVRILGKAQLKSLYIPDIWVHMRMGGVSTQSWKSRWILNREIVRACRENGIHTNIFKVLMKIPLKLFELR